MSRSAIPAATYRLQLHHAFTFSQAEALVPYFADLGVSHLYLSPILKARAGSLHGYDVVDHSEINPELGGVPALRALAAACHRAGLGMIVDIVPNHMAVGNENPYWQDVLKHGKASHFAAMFDIDFAPLDPRLAGKVVIPTLGEPYGQALAEGKFKLVETADGGYAVTYGPHNFPVRPEDCSVISAGALSAWEDAARLHALLEKQNFHLCWWRAAGDVINWRRFFDVNELAGLRVEDDAVFDRVHDVTMRLYAEGVLDGVRVDHIDGLADPAAYARKLRTRLEALNAQRPADAPKDGPYLIIEKIIGEGESLPADWQVDGTSGYDFMNEVNALQHDPQGEAVLQGLWREIRGQDDVFHDMESSARREVLRGSFAGQLADCARAFAAIAAIDIQTRDLTEEAFRRSLVALISHLRVYRSYATGRPGSPKLAHSFAEAFAAARASLPADDAAFAFIQAILEGAAGGAEESRADAVRRLNQLCAPVAAKAVEDTAFYRYGKLLSRNDVGFSASQFALDPETFMASGQARATHWPRAMLTTATHDHKRGEDVRARLAVLSELPDLWATTVRYWLGITAPQRPTAVAPDDAYTLFQTLVGSWPVGLRPDHAEGLASFCERVAGWRRKSLREGKVRSSWAVPDETYETANLDWLESLLDRKRSSSFLYSLVDFVERITPAGAINGVVQAALRCAWPGVPDLYQGAEWWDLSLVDPDNRRPVDYAARQAALKDRDTTDVWRTGSIKQTVIRDLLDLRRAEPAMFTQGSLTRVEVRGTRAAHVLGFRRAMGDRAVLIAVTLHMAEPVLALGQMPDGEWWGDTALAIGDSWRDAAQLFGTKPVFLETEEALAGSN